MTRPLTCLTLLAAAGAGLYLYQEKHRAQLLDREINRTVHATEQTRERVGTMRAEWAALNNPERLATLAAQHLTLQSLAPAQFAQLADLGTRLPAVGAPTQPPAPIEAAGPLMTAAPIKAAPVAQAALPRPAHPVRLAAAKPPEADPHPLFAPIVQAFASQAPAQPVRPPSVQQAAAGLSAAPYAGGSALGMAHALLAAPVPVAAGDPLSR